MSEWQVIWSHQVEGPVNDVEIDEHGALVASGQTLFSLRNDGSLHWRSDQILMYIRLKLRVPQLQYNGDIDSRLG